MKNENQKSKKEKSGSVNTEAPDGVKGKLDSALFHDADIAKAQVREWLVKDMRGVYILIAEVLASEECVDALTEIFYGRYQKLHKDKVQTDD